MPEDDVLIRHYPISGAVGVSLFIDRVPGAIKSRCQTLRRAGADIPLRDDSTELVCVDYEEVPYHMRISVRRQNYIVPQSDPTLAQNARR